MSNTKAGQDATDLEEYRATPMYSPEAVLPAGALSAVSRWMRDGSFAYPPKPRFLTLAPPEPIPPMLIGRTCLRPWCLFWLLAAVAVFLLRARVDFLRLTSTPENTENIRRRHTIRPLRLVRRLINSTQFFRSRIAAGFPGTAGAAGDSAWRLLR